MKEIINKIKENKKKEEDYYSKIHKLEEEYDVLIEKLCSSVKETDLRPMILDDEKVGQLYFGWDGDGYYIGVIQEILSPGDTWKAWTATDGCRYGSADHWVLKTQQSKPQP